MYHLDKDVHNNHVDNLDIIKLGINLNPIEPSPRLEDEEWKVMKEYDRYRVSNKGRVYSMIQNKIIKQRIKDSKLYIKINMGKNKYKDYSVHKLIYEVQ